MFTLTFAHFTHTHTHIPKKGKNSPPTLMLKLSKSQPSTLWSIHIIDAGGAGTLGHCGPGRLRQAAASLLPQH